MPGNPPQANHGREQEDERPNDVNPVLNTPAHGTVNQVNPHVTFIHKGISTGKGDNDGVVEHQLRCEPRHGYNVVTGNDLQTEKRNRKAVGAEDLLQKDDHDLLERHEQHKPSCQLADGPVERVDPAGNAAQDGPVNQASDQKRENQREKHEEELGRFAEHQRVYDVFISWKFHSDGLQARVLKKFC